jgi:hypothetical protein
MTKNLAENLLIEPKVAQRILVGFLHDEIHRTGLTRAVVGPLGRNRLGTGLPTGREALGRRMCWRCACLTPPHRPTRWPTRSSSSTTPA